MHSPLRSSQDVRPSVVFLDRDGVINRDSSEYIKGWDEFEFLPGSIRAIRRLTAQGVPVIIITNQSAVGRGLITQAGLDYIHKMMRKAIRRAGGRITDIFYCPHHPEDECVCRKPKPGMIRAAAENHTIDLSNACMIGDSAKDIECARNAGCSQTILVQTGNGKIAAAALREKGITPTHVAQDLFAAVEWLLAG